MSATPAIAVDRQLEGQDWYVLLTIPSAASLGTGIAQTLPERQVRLTLQEACDLTRNLEFAMIEPLQCWVVGCHNYAEDDLCPGHIDAGKGEVRR